MAIAKVCGIETEYGIHGGDGNPITASSLLINAYVADVERRIGWDFEDESPGNDARGFAREGSMPPSVETHLANTVLTNGARYYVDHAHPEYSTPECANPLELVVHDKAGEVILRRSMAAARRIFPDAVPVVVYKNNSDGKGNSYGCHENYLVDRALPFAKIVTGVVPHFVTRQIFTGAGKVGSETASFDRVDFQITQRADFFEEEVGLETTLKRPIINTRDEPHADPRRYRRLHVIVGDANLSEVATFLKVGTTALVLAMIEDDAMPARDFSPADPVRAMHDVSPDLTLAAPLDLADGSTATALEIQWDLLTAARKYAEERGLEVLGDELVGQMVLDRWEAVLGGLETDPTSLARQLDWVAKYQLMTRTWTGTAATGATTGSPPSTCSTTTFGRSGRSSPGWAWSDSSTDADVEPRGDDAADRHAGLLPGPVPRPVARSGRRRQLGLDRLRPRSRPAPPGPDDGASQGDGRVTSVRSWRRAPARPSCWSD